MTGPHMLVVPEPPVFLSADPEPEPTIEHPPSCERDKAGVYLCPIGQVEGEFKLTGYFKPADGQLLVADEWDVWTDQQIRPGRHLIEFDGVFRVVKSIRNGVEPVTRTVKRHYCPGCGAGRMKEAAARAHIGRCWFVPENRGCKTCIHFEAAGSEQDEQGFAYAQWDESCTTHDGPEIDRPIIGCPLWEPQDGAA